MGLVRRILLLVLSVVSLCAGALTSTAADASAPAGAAIPASRQARSVFIITIEGPITNVTAYSVKRRIAAAHSEGADAVVFELNTPGGAVGATLEICDAIKNSPVANTVAWVRTQAYSAGAFIALACREIVVAESATMGDAAPIAALPGLGIQSLGATERQKILAPILAEIVDSARRNGYDELLVQAFVSLGIELWLVEERATGKRYFITEAEYRRLFDGAPLRTAPRMASGQMAGGAPAAPPDADPAAPSPAPAPGAGDDRVAFRPASPELAGASPDVNMALSSASGRPLFTDARRGDFDLIEYTTDGQTLLVLKSDDMKRYGLASATIRTDDELKAFFGAASIRRRDATWSEALVVFLSHIIVRGALIAALLISLFIEMAAPGVGVAGAIATVCALALLAPPVLIGAAGWWTAVAVVVGIVLIIAELLLFPGVIVLGGAGALLLMAGLVGSFVSGDRGAMSDEIVHGLATTMLALFVAGIAMYFIGKTYGRIPVLDRLVLADSRADSGATSLLAAMAAQSAAPIRVGDTGVAVTTLRPAGAAEISGRLVDVVSEIGFIDEGAAVTVVSVTPYRVAVERAKPASADGAGA